MISGAGMLDFLACHSIEKLVIDAEAIASAQRLIGGIEPLTEILATGMFAQTGLQGDFLKLKETRALFRREQHFPSSIIDRGADTGNGNDNIRARARFRINELLAGYAPPRLAADREFSLREFAAREAKKIGFSDLPGLSRQPASLHAVL
jgi:trimethylamine:corrinoid methyltransferase-like protein